MAEFKQETLKLQKKQNLIKRLQDELSKALSTNASWLWSNNPHCPDKKLARQQEEDFASRNIMEIDDEVVTIRPTGKGFYSILKYKFIYTYTPEDAEPKYDVKLEDFDYTPVDYSNVVSNVETFESPADSVVLCLNYWYLDLPFKLAVSYGFHDHTKKDTVSYFLNYFRKTKPTNANDITLAKNIERIESNIPDTKGNPTTGGPRRVCIFALNNLCEVCLVEDSALSDGVCAALGIGKLELADNTHDTFHQGGGTPLPDLKDVRTGVHYEFKGPKATDFDSVNKTKNAKFILHLDLSRSTGPFLVLYESTATGYVAIKAVPVKANSPLYKMSKYDEIADECPSSWEEYWK